MCERIWTKFHWFHVFIWIRYDSNYFIGIRHCHNIHTENVYVSFVSPFSRLTPIFLSSFFLFVSNNKIKRVHQIFLLLVSLFKWWPKQTQKNQHRRRKQLWVIFPISFNFTLKCLEMWMIYCSHTYTFSFVLIWFLFLFLSRLIYRLTKFIIDFCTFLFYFFIQFIPQQQKTNRIIRSSKWLHTIKQ